MGNPTIEEYFLQNTDWKGIDWNYLAFRFPYLQKLLLGFTFRIENSELQAFLCMAYS